MEHVKAHGVSCFILLFFCHRSSSLSTPKRPRRTWRWPSWRRPRVSATSDVRWAAVCLSDCEKMFLVTESDMTEIPLTCWWCLCSCFPRFYFPSTSAHLQLPVSPLLFLPFFVWFFCPRFSSNDHSHLCLFLKALLFNLCWLRQLHKVAVGRASDLLKVHGEQLPLRALKAAGAEGNLEEVAEYSRTLTEQKEQLVEVGGIRGTGSRGTSRRVTATWICGWKSVVMFAFIWSITFWCHSNHCAFLGKHTHKIKKLK